MNSPAASHTINGYTFRTPVKDEGKVLNLRKGMCTADFRTITVDLDHHSIYQGPNKSVPTDAKYVEAAREYANTLTAWNEDVLVQTSDGAPLLWFIKKGMTKWDRLGPLFAEMSWKAAQFLALMVEPPRNFDKDPRHRDKAQQRYDWWKAKGCKYGVYHFYYRVLQGQPVDTAKLSFDAKPESPEGRAAIQEYLSWSKWEHRVAALWLKALAPDVQESYNARYVELRDKIGDMDIGDSGCFLSKTLIVNAIVDPHKDTDEFKEGFVLTYPFGDFTGADQVYLELGMRFHQEPGDLLVAPAQRLTHFGLKVESGQRFGHAFSTRQTVQKVPEHTHMCNECPKGYTTKGKLQNHVRDHHPKDVYGNPTALPRYYCRVVGCTSKGATQGYSAEDTLRGHYKTKHPGLSMPRTFEDKTRPPTSNTPAIGVTIDPANDGNKQVNDGSEHDPKDSSVDEVGRNRGLQEHTA